MSLVSDWLWPHVTGEAEVEPVGLSLLSNAPTDAHLDFIEREVREAGARETERNQSVQSRLTALLGLSSLLASLTSGMVGLALTSFPIDVSRVQLAAIVLVLSYLALQFVAAMFRTARGLLPRRVGEIQPEALDPEENETAIDFRRAILSTHRSNLLKTRWSTNRRMEEMTCAVLALRNASMGAMGLMLVGLLIILDRHFGVGVHFSFDVPVAIYVNLASP